LLQDELPAGAYGRLLLMPGAKRRWHWPHASPQVCTCFNVSEDAIRTTAHCGGTDDERLASCKQLQCGTNCGSCLPGVAPPGARTAQSVQKR
jgi:assimilatory nitrate reductase catalytic subunit